MATVTLRMRGTESEAGTAQFTAVAPPTNDDLADVVDLAGSSGSTTYSDIGSTLEDGEIDWFGSSDASGLTEGSVWFRFTHTSDGQQATVTLDPLVGAEIWSLETGDTVEFDNMAPHGGSPDPIQSHTQVTLSLQQWTVTALAGSGIAAWRTEAGKVYYLRCNRFEFTEPAAGRPLSYLFADPEIDLRLQTTSLLVTPLTVLVDVNGSSPGETISFTLDSDPAVLQTVVLDDDGEARGVSVQIPSLSAGVHVLVASDGTLTSGTQGTFSVSDRFAYAPTPVAPAHEGAADPFEQPNGVLSFVLTDPSDASTYVFPYNPNLMGYPGLDRQLSTVPTTAQSGQMLVFEGAPIGKPFQLTGYLFDLAQVNDLRAWVAKNYRVWLTDDLGHVWIVVLRAFKPTPVRDLTRPQLHSFQLTALMLGREADLSPIYSPYPATDKYPGYDHYPADPGS